MTKETLVNIIKNSDESNLVEYKTNYFDKDGIGEYISALANSAALQHAQEAYMIWGVEDETKNIVGTKFTLNETINKEPYEHYLSRKLEPANYDIEEFEIEDKRVVVLTIYASKEVITEFDGKRYIRIGSSKAQLKKYPYLESKLWAVLSHNEFSLIKEESYRQDLTFKVFKIYLNESDITFSDDNFKKNFNLLTNDGKYNYLAFMLSDQFDMSFKVVKYDGKNKQSNMISRMEFGRCCILKTIDDVINYIKTIENKMITTFDSVSMRHDEYLFNMDAVSEAWKNACVHNDYSGKSGPAIFIFTNHLEIFSHGSPLTVQSKSNFLKAYSKPINPELAKIFMRVDKYDESGKGVNTILKFYSSDVFVFDDDNQVFNVSIPFNQKVLTAFGTENGTDNDTENEGSFSSSESLVLKELQQKKEITRKELSQRTNLSERSVARTISSLKQKGLIARSGSDRSGYWKILK